MATGCDKNDINGKSYDRHLVVGHAIAFATYVRRPAACALRAEYRADLVRACPILLARFVRSTSITTRFGTPIGRMRLLR